MPTAQVDIERIVREVMRRLEVPQSAGDGAGTEIRTPPEPKPDNSKLRLSGRVVTLASLDGRLAGVRQVIVAKGTVVTPAVRDELRKKKIKLEFSDNNHRANVSAGGVLLGIVEGSFDAAALLRAISAEVGETQRIEGSCWIEITRQMTEAIAGEAKCGVLVTCRATAAVCLANRRPAIRAALGAGTASVKDAMETIGANLLVVDPASNSLYELRGMVREFVGGCHECPDRLKTVLEHD
jgi:ribose 5-phosphate isomerase RpiB